MPAAHLVGIFPRSEDLIAATRSAERGRVDAAALEDLFAADTERVVALQVHNGLDRVTDGLLRWQDLFRPLSDGIPGMHAGAVTRWFDNNTFYRRPVVERRLEPTGRAVLQATAVGALRGRAWKAVLPSPWALASLAEDHAYGDRRALLDDVAEVLRQEVQGLTGAGCAYVQFSDPVLVGHRENGDVAGARRALEHVVSGVTVRTALHTFFGDAAPIWPALLEFPVDEVGFDLFATQTDRLAGRASGKTLLIGAIDGRNSLLEDVEETAGAVLRLGERLGADDLSVVPNCDLEFLPWDVAVKKVERLGQVRRRLAGR